MFFVIDSISKNLFRIKFHSPWLNQETLTVLMAADLLVLPTRGEQALVSVPSKLLSYMLSGCCILAMAPSNSEIAGIITSSGAGWVNSTNDFGALATCISEISDLSLDERCRRGQAGRDFVLTHFSKSTNITEVVKILNQMGDQSE